jgi:hypothetical protein
MMDVAPSVCEMLFVPAQNRRKHDRLGSSQIHFAPILIHMNDHQSIVNFNICIIAVKREHPRLQSSPISEVSKGQP